MKSPHTYILAAILGALIWSAQAAADVRISGRISDPRGEAVAGAMVKAKEGSKIIRFGLSDETGAYSLSLPDSVIKSGVAEISSLGFSPLSLTLAQLAKDPNVRLKTDVTTLAEFEVKERSAAVKRPDWIADAVIYQANVRQASPQRNLNGLAERLYYLKNLEANVLLLTPIHPVSKTNRQFTFGSPYAIADYTSVNPEFGSMADLKALVKKAHGLGMKVILDEACAFSGTDHPWVAQHPEFYQRDEQGQFVSPPGRSDLYKFNYDNPDWRTAMIDALVHLVKQTKVDGFRFEATADVPLDFWVRARKTLQKEKPMLFIADASGPELLAEAFDVDYSPALRDTFSAIAASQKVGANLYMPASRRPADAGAIELIESLNKRLGTSGIHANMTSNYALNAAQGTEFDRYGDAARAFAVLSYTLPGLPMIYTGQEVGWKQRFRPGEEDEVPDTTYNPPMRTFYSKLNILRRRNPALFDGFDQKGSFRIIPTTSPDIVAFERTSDKQRVLVFVNLSNEPQDVNFPTANRIPLRWSTISSAIVPLKYPPRSNPGSFKSSQLFRLLNSPLPLLTTLHL